MDTNLIATASILIDAPMDRVWGALVDPAAIKQYMFGTNVITDWKEGSPIVWKGVWEGKQYEDKGVLLQVRPNQRLRYTHYSPLAGKADKPENYHTVTIELSRDGNQTRVSLAQDNNANEQAREHSEKNWKMMLTSLKTLLEKEA